MNNSFSSPPENTSTQEHETINVQRAFWAAIIFTFVALTSVVTSVFLVGSNPIWQVYTIAAITVIALAADFIGMVLIWRGRTGLGLNFFYWSLMFTVPPNALLVTNTTPYLIGIVLVVGAVHVFYLQPRARRNSLLLGPIIAAMLMAAVEIWQPSFRANLISTSVASGYIGPVMFIFLVFSLLALVVRQAWSGNIRVKLVTSFTVVTLVAVVIVSYTSYLNLQKQIRADIGQRLINMTSIVASQQNGDLHAAIQSPEDMAGDAYKIMESQATKIAATDPNIAYIYTMRMNEQGQIYFIIDAGQRDYKPGNVGIIYQEPSDLLLENFKTLDHTIVEKDFYTDEYGTVLSAYAPIYRADGTREAIVGVDFFADNILGGESMALAQERAAQTQIVIVAIATMLLVAAIGFFLGNLFTKPITNLTSVAQQIAAGDLSTRAQIETSDEVGTLASAFNTMTSRLQEILEGLEQRVAERTRNLELAAQVGRTVSQLHALDIILKDATELIRKEFDLYYVQVYLTDPSQTHLNLQAGTGLVGEQLLKRSHRLAINLDSINGRAAIEKKSVVISDTTSSATFKPNPLLPDTQSEMAVPLVIGNRVVGVLDMQSEHKGSLSQDVLPAFEALAGQLAVAIQNANLLAEAEQARAEVEKQTARLSRTNWSEYLDAIHQPEQVGFMFAGDKITPIVDKEQAEIAADVEALAAPIAVTGETLGALVVEMDSSKQNVRTVELVNAVARQVSQQIENLRLLDSAERYRADAEQAARRQTLEGWHDYTDANANKGLSYIYDLKEVRPHDPNTDQQAETSAYSLPLKVRDETVGRLVVQGLEAGDSESHDLVNEVAERLSAHIENLRLSEQTLDRARREQALRQITSAVRGSTDPATILRSAARELGSLLGRKTVVRLTTAREAQTSQPLRPADPMGEAIANNGNELISPAQSPNADGGKE
jgi:GAF domain-containing protein/HAMP domain-containing protein